LFLFVALFMEGRQFLAELKHRGVYSAAAYYSAGAWALLQVADITFPLLGWSDGLMMIILLVAAVGFPAVLILAWFFDLTSKGLVEAPDSVATLGRPNLSFTQVVELTLLVVLILLVGYLYIDRLTLSAGTNPIRVTDVTSTTAQRPSIAVMPFISMSSDNNVEYFGDGLAEEILNLLAKLNELNVAARTSSFFFKGKDVDIQQIADHLGVRYILEGSVRHENNRIRVTAQLIDAQNGFHLWSETYDRDLDDVFGLQDEISGQVVKQLQVILSPDSQELLARQGTANPRAYDAYLQARDILRRPVDLVDLDKAVDTFRLAIKLDPEFAGAYAGLCDSLLARHDIRVAGQDFEDAEKACHRALTRDAKALPVYIALGNLYRNSGQYSLAEREFKQALVLNEHAVDAKLGLARTYASDSQGALAEEMMLEAIETQPNYWRGYLVMGNHLYYSGRIAESIAYYEQIVTLMPGSGAAANNLGASYYMMGRFEEALAIWQGQLVSAPSAIVYSNIGSSLFFLERFDEAVEMYDFAVQLTPEDFEIWGNLGDAYRQGGNEEASLAMYQRALSLAEEQLERNSTSGLVLARKAYYLALLGRELEARQYLSRAIDAAPLDIQVTYFNATTYCVLGELELAMDNVEQALELGYPWFILQADAGLKSLRNMPRYEALNNREE
jgi:TolB-like protein/tetratricopeptide (TPR) repeat protein